MQAVLVDQLRKANRRITAQRMQVFEGVKGLDSHPSALEVFEAVKPRLPSISLATVYRNLHILRLEGLLREIHCDRGITRFDSNLSEHYHFHCTSCQRVSDVPSYSREIERSFSEKTGLHISGHHLTFQGLCNDCLKVEPSR